jgi:thiamine pyrophosphate-dependent acetolactate synthase large subunit-like protein
VQRSSWGRSWGPGVKPTDVAQAVVHTFPEALCVAALGTAVSALRMASGDGPHWYYGAAMGSALAGAMGVAEALPDRLVVALLGDGELLMGASTLWSVSAYRPANLIGVVLADGKYSITGGQQLAPSPRFVEVSQALGGIDSARVRTAELLRTALLDLHRPCLIEAVVDDWVWPGPSPFVDPARVRIAFEDNVADGTIGTIRALTSGAP